MAAEVELEGAEALLAALAGAGVPVPEIGEELDGGVVGELVWREARVAVVDAAFVGADDVAALEQAGWRVLVAPVDAAALIEVLGGRPNGPPGRTRGEPSR